MAWMLPGRTNAMAAGARSGRTTVTATRPPSTSCWRADSRACCWRRGTIPSARSPPTTSRPRSTILPFPRRRCGCRSAPALSTVASCSEICIYSSLPLRGQRGASLTGAHSPPLRGRRGASLTAPLPSGHRRTVGLKTMLFDCLFNLDMPGRWSPPQQAVDYRDEDQGGQRGNGQAADDRTAERRVLLPAFAEPQGHGQHAQDHGEGGHEDGTETRAPRGQPRLDARLPRAHLVIREGHQQDAIRGRYAHTHDRAHQGRHTEGRVGDKEHPDDPAQGSRQLRHNDE